MIGNVAEWCRDEWHAYETSTPRPGDGLRLAPSNPAPNRVLRGGSFRERPLMRGKTSTRQDDIPDRLADYIGLRPSRPLQEPHR